jgi:hypothetical protein
MDKLLRAVYRDKRDGYPTLDLNFEVRGCVSIDSSVRRPFVEAGLVWVNDPNVPDQSFTYPNGEIITLTGFIRHEEAAAVIKRYFDALDRNADFADGEIIYNCE